MEWQAELELAAGAAVAAGRAIMRAFGRDMEVTHKGPEQPLTASDLEADRILHKILLGSRPDYGWLSEETADDPARLARRRVWIVDPIDGTRSFISGRREFAVSVGLAEDGVAVVGVVLNPATGELYAAIRGHGAWKLEHAGARDPLPSLDEDVSWQRLRVRTGGSDRPVILASRTEIHEGELEPFAAWEVKGLGSTTYKLAKLAEGAADAFLSRGPKSEWDLCAAALLVEEAGGVATDLRGEVISYNSPDPQVYGVLAAPPAMHGEVLRMVAELPPTARLARRAADPLHPGLHEED